jgi:tungstate transport system substrate-binding protein
VAVCKDIVTALQTIKAKSALFISRRDRSGTNIAEIEFWKDAGIDIAKDKGPATRKSVRAWARR